LIDINCDMGEGIGNEEALMPFIHSANIACGYHAGDATTMRQVISLCLQHAVHIGAHPSFLDKENFGRTAMQLPAAAIYSMITEQLKTINAIALECGATLHHIKPHGALYNMAATDSVLGKVVAQAVKDFDASLIYYGLSGSVMIAEADKLGLKTFNEVFADRTYQDDGTLTPRSESNALLTDVNNVQQQVLKFVKENKVATVTGHDIFVQADTICIHGDGPDAVDFAKAVYKQLHEV
jgi:5-oxoprolinase (ATP-hydrolysing) subunit A